MLELYGNIKKWFENQSCCNELYWQIDNDSYLYWLNINKKIKDTIAATKYCLGLTLDEESICFHTKLTE